MRVRILGLVILSVLGVSTAVSFAQQRRTRSNPAPAPAPTAPQSDLRIRYRTTTSGQSHESATMIKGKRERSEMRMGYGSDIINITQCDLKRTIQVSEATRKYVITPMEPVDPTPANSGSARPTNAAVEPGRRGGVVNYTTTINDTGERKEMFGFTARHIKSTLTIESSTDACSAVKQRMETDGWYIDLTFGLDCDLTRTHLAGARPMPQGGCRDQIVMKQLGSGRKGYPLIETTTMYGPGGQAMFTTTKEVIDLSREPLDAALFDVPVGYTEATDSQELYGAPSMASIMSQASQTKSSQAQAQIQTQANSEPQNAGMSSAMSKTAGMLRVGVVAINNRSDRPVSLETLRQRLVGGIKSNGIDAVPLNGISATEIEAEAKAKQCDFVLYTDITALKISAVKKLGGFLGKAAGIGGADKTESRLDFKLFAVGETSPRLQASTSAKEEGDEASAGLSVDNEANKVSAEVKKKPRS